MFRIRFALYDYVGIIGKKGGEGFICFSLLLHINRCSKILLPPASSASSDAVHRSDSR